MNSTKLLNFEGHHLFLGLDVHLKSWRVTIYGDEFELRTFSQEPDVKQLANWIYRNYPNATIHCVYEAGFSGYWIQRQLVKYGINCIITHPADVPSSDKEKKHKSDRVDSRKLARSLRNGDLTAIHIPDEKQEQDRSLLRVRNRLTRNQTRVKTRIKFFLMNYGIKIPQEIQNSSWSRKYVDWLENLDFDYPSGRQALRLYVEEYQQLRKLLLNATRQIRALSKTQSYAESVKLLTSIPGIALITAMVFLTEIGDINRFKSLKNLCSYFRLVPNMRGSGEHEHVAGITRRGNSYLKYIIIESAWTAMRSDPALYLYYKKVVRHTDENKTIVKVARKLLNRIRYVLKNRQPYVSHVAA